MIFASTFSSSSSASASASSSSRRRPGLVGLAAVAGVLLSRSVQGASFSLADKNEMLRLVNAERAAVGADALVWDSSVESCLQGHVDEGNLSHVGLDGSSPGDRLAVAGISNNGWGENLGQGDVPVLGMVDLWMTSTLGHRENMLSTSWKCIGAAEEAGSTGHPLWGQLFIGGASASCDGVDVDGNVVDGSEEDNSAPVGYLDLASLDAYWTTAGQYISDNKVLFPWNGYPKELASLTSTGEFTMTAVRPSGSTYYGEVSADLQTITWDRSFLTGATWERSSSLRRLGRVGDVEGLGPVISSSTSSAGSSRARSLRAGGM